MADYSKESNKTIKYYKAKDSSDDALYDCVKIAILGNAKTIILPNDTYGNVLHKIQYEYPDVNFIFLDKAIVDENGNEDINNNVVCLKTADEQAGFLAGYAAVMDGYRSLGFMGGMALPSVIDFGYGFAQGAEYAGKELNLKDGEISLKYCCTRTCCICIRYMGRNYARKTYVQAYKRQNQSAYRISRCICSFYGSTCFTESR